MSKLFKNIKLNPFKYLFFGVLLFYMGFYSPYGFEDGDMGSVFGISWSMYNGQFPFKDFTYIKPPGSPFFHSLILYFTETYGYLFTRVFYYIQVFTYSYLTVAILFNHFKINSKKTLFFLATLGAIISIHNYPPMAWNTVDGIFFSILGCFILLKNKNTVKTVLLGSFFIIAGVLCKQSFYFFPVFLSLYLLIEKKYKALIYFLIGALLWISIFLIYLYFNDALALFFKQTLSYTPGSGLINSGFKAYYLALKFSAPYLLAVLIVIGISYKYMSRNTGYLLINIGIALYMIYVFLNEDSYHNFKAYIIQILFVASVLFSLYQYIKKEEKTYSLLLLFLGLAWCASISNGFKTPIHFTMPMVFAFYMMVYKKEAINSFIGYSLLGLFLFTFYLGYQNVYQDSKRNYLTYNMGKLYPQLTGIKTDENTFNKYVEFKKLTKNYSNFTVLPSMTLAHYLSRTINPIGVDWVLNHHLTNNIESYANKLETKNVTVFLENFETTKPHYEKEARLGVYIRDHWQLIAENSFFRIYKPIKVSKIKPAKKP